MKVKDFIEWVYLNKKYIKDLDDVELEVSDIYKDKNKLYLIFKELRNPEVRGYKEGDDYYRYVTFEQGKINSKLPVGVYKKDKI